MDTMISNDKVETDFKLPWIEKYRPSSLDELIAHEEVIRILNKLIDSNKLPHLLFYGPPGSGKTSTILGCAKKLYGERYSSMILELNASDDRGIDVVREQIKEFAGTRNMFSNGLKLIVLDEADAMTNDAQSALRRVIEKYTSNTRFCLICNYVNKIIPALQSRCTRFADRMICRSVSNVSMTCECRFRFSPLRAEQISSRLLDIAKIERVNMVESGKEALLQLAGGDMRRVLNLLQATHMAYSLVDEDAVYLTAGAAVPKVIDAAFHSLMNNDFRTAHEDVSKSLSEFGYALCDVVSELSKRILEFEFPGPVLNFLIEKLSRIEYRLSHGASEKLQLGAVIGAFIAARKMIDVKG